MRGIQRYDTAVRCVVFLFVPYRMLSALWLAIHKRITACFPQEHVETFSCEAHQHRSSTFTAVGIRINVICGMYVRTRRIVMMWYILICVVAVRSIRIVRAHTILYHSTPVVLFSFFFFFLTPVFNTLAVLL